MKKLVKILPVLLAFVIALSIGATAAEDVAETTAAVQEETTTQPEEDTITAPSTPDEETTQPEVTEPEETEPTEPEIKIPEAPVNLRCPQIDDAHHMLYWDAVEGADGYEVNIKATNGTWVPMQETAEAEYGPFNLLKASEYQYAVRSFVLVDTEKKYSDYSETLTVKTSPVAKTVLKAKSTKEGIELSWEEIEGVSGYRLWIRQGGKWVKIADVGSLRRNYVYEKAKAGTSYYFAIKGFVKGAQGTKYGEIATVKITFKDVTKAVIKSGKATNSAVTLTWNKVEGAKGYRVFKYNPKTKKYDAVKTTSALSYQITGLQASTKYYFRVRAYYKVNGNTVWYPYSDKYAVTTLSKTVKAYRVNNLKKYFSDGDWAVKIYGLTDEYGDKFDYLIAGKGKNLYERYTYKIGGRIDFLYLNSKNRLYAISPDDKEYVLFNSEQTKALWLPIYSSAELLKVQNVGKVTAKTCIYGGKTAVAETYKDSVYGWTKTYYFVGDTLVGFKAVTADGDVIEYATVRVFDTPSNSYFKLPSGYKKVAYY